MPEIISPEVECLKLKQAINENHRLAQKAAGDAVQRALVAGELLGKWKELLPHGEFEPFVEKHFEGSQRTAQRYILAAKEVKSLPKASRMSLLSTEDTLSGLLVRVKKDDSGAPPKGSAPAGTRIKPANSSAESKDAQPDSISEKGRPGGGLSPSSTVPPASATPEPGEAADSSGEETDSGTKPQETDPRPPRSGKDKPVGYGKCPNCAGTKWTEDEFGVACSKCHHPHGEPVGDRTEDDPAGTLRAKTVKTVESLMRCLDDLNLLVPKAGTHKQTIELCKSLLKSAKSWK